MSELEGRVAARVRQLNVVLSKLMGHGKKLSLAMAADTGPAQTECAHSLFVACRLLLEEHLPKQRTESVPAAYGEIVETVARALATAIGRDTRSAALHELQ